MDQRGAAVILWSFFMMSIAIYIVIAHNVLDNPKYARVSFAETANNSAVDPRLGRSRLLLFLEKALSHATGDSSQLSEDKTFLELCRNTKGPSRTRRGRINFRNPEGCYFAIIEAIAVYGLVLAIVGRYLLDQYLLSALSLALLLLSTHGTTQGLVREVRTVSPPNWALSIANSKPVNPNPTNLRSASNKRGR